jgi:hypothetical protein
MNEVFSELFKQGLGYVLFLGAVLIIFYQYKVNREDNKKYSNDIKEITITFTNTAKDLLNGNNSLQKSIDMLTNIINTKRFK